MLNSFLSRTLSLPASFAAYFMTAGIASFGAPNLISAALSSLLLIDPLWLVSTTLKILSVSAYDYGAQPGGL